MLSAWNWDDDHIIIRGGKFTRINIADRSKQRLYDVSYQILNKSYFSPPTGFLLISSGFSDGGNGNYQKIIYYYSEGKLKYLETMNGGGIRNKK